LLIYHFEFQRFGIQECGENRDEEVRIVKARFAKFRKDLDHKIIGGSRPSIRNKEVMNSDFEKTKEHCIVNSQVPKF